MSILHVSGFVGAGAGVIRNTKQIPHISVAYHEKKFGFLIMYSPM